MNIIIASDLHLSIEEKEYSLSVLEEIFMNAIGKDALFLLGDIFDSFTDAEELRSDFKRLANNLKKPIYYIVGNHEKIGMLDRSMEQLNLGDRVLIIDSASYSQFYIKGVDIIALSYQENYGSYHKWKVERKEEHIRIFLSHGIVQGTMWFVDGDQNNVAAIPKNLLELFAPDIAILGHIHQKLETKIMLENKHLDVIYPGSSRICNLSKSEIGERYIISLDYEEKQLDINYIPLLNAGKYLRYNFNINGQLYDNLKMLASSWTRDDIIEIKISGIVESGSQSDKIIKNIENQYKKIVNKLIISTEKILILNNITNESILTEFLSISDKYKREKGESISAEILEIAKIMGVEKIAEAIKARK